MINTHEAGAHFQIITDNEDPFSGFDKGYGIFKNPRNYLACVMDTSFPDALERAGYFAEEFVVKATELGLGTCFIGGTYNASKADIQLRPDWKLLFIVVFGYPYSKERPLARLMKGVVHMRKRENSYYYESGEASFNEMASKYHMLPTAIEALRCAPSSLNRQPAKIRVSGSGGLEIFADASNPKNLIDLGIAKFNVSYATGSDIEWGNPAPLFVE